METVLDILAILGLPAVIATMLLAHMRPAKKDAGKDKRDGQGARGR